MNERRKLLALPEPDELNYVVCDLPQVQVAVLPTMSIDKKAVYGRDLNDSDLLLIGVNDVLRNIVTEEYNIECDVWEYPEAFSTTSRKVIVGVGERKYFIKEKPKYCCNSYSLALSSEFQEFLSKKTDFVPKIRYTRSGESYLQYGSAMLFTTEYKEGRIFNASVKDVEKAGIALGKIHTLSSDFRPSVTPKNIRATDDTEEFIELAYKLRGAENDLCRDKTINFLKEVVHKYKERVDCGVDYILNHADYAPFNLVYSNSGEVVAVNDFDNVNYRPRVRDVAGAVLSFCDGLSYAGATSSLRRPISTSLNIEKTKKFLDGYFSSSEQLTDLERDSMVGEIMIRWVKIMCLGLVRGDFNYNDVLNARVFQSHIEAEIRKLI